MPITVKCVKELCKSGIKSIKTDLETTVKSFYSLVHHISVTENTSLHSSGCHILYLLGLYIK